MATRAILATLTQQSLLPMDLLAAMSDLRNWQLLIFPRMTPEKRLLFKKKLFLAIVYITGVARDPTLEGQKGVVKENQGVVSTKKPRALPHFTSF